MNSQYCRVGRISASAYIIQKLKVLEAKYLQYIEDAHNEVESDQNRGDELYHEVTQIKCRILRLGKSKLQIL